MKLQNSGAGYIREALTDAMQFGDVIIVADMVFPMMKLLAIYVFIRNWIPLLKLWKIWPTVGWNHLFVPLENRRKF